MLTINNIRKFLISGFALSILFSAGLVYAQATSSPTQDPAPIPPAISFPIPELGNCASKDACKAYCADTTHAEACLTFAQSHGLMKSDETQKARTFLKLKGPGGCVGQACKTYCEDPLHSDECLSFAKTNHLISDSDAKIADDIKTIGGPGGCKSSTECRAFCSVSANFDACRKFAEDHNLRSPHVEASDQMGPSSPRVRQGPPDQLRGKINDILATKPGPGGCTDADACKIYCADSSHIEECVQFAKDNGLMTGEQADQARKFQKPGPGGCLGETCKEYCRDTTHLDECRQFSIQNGFMPKDPRGQFENGSSTRPVLRQGPDGPRDPRDVQGTSSRPMMFDTSSLKGRCSTSEECKKVICSEHPDMCENGAPKINVINQGAGTTPPPQPSEEMLKRAQEKCAQFGGTWDGLRCMKPSGTSPATETQQMPPKPPMPSLDQIKERCAQYGGTWDGQHCLKPNTSGDSTANGGNMPPPPPPSIQSQKESPTSMTPLTAFTASVFSIFFQLFR